MPPVSCRVQLQLGQHSSSPAPSPPRDALVLLRAVFLYLYKVCYHRIAQAPCSDVPGGGKTKHGDATSLEYWELNSWPLIVIFNPIHCSANRSFKVRNRKLLSLLLNGETADNHALDELSTTTTSKGCCVLSRGVFFHRLLLFVATSLWQPEVSPSYLWDRRIRTRMLDSYVQVRKSLVVFHRVAHDQMTSHDQLTKRLDKTLLIPEGNSGQLDIKAYSNIITYSYPSAKQTQTIVFQTPAFICTQ